MQIGFVGLGKMGGNMVRRILPRLGPRGRRLRTIDAEVDPGARPRRPA